MRARRAKGNSRGKRRQHAEEDRHGGAATNGTHARQQSFSRTVCKGEGGLARFPRLRGGTRLAETVGAHDGSAKCAAAAPWDEEEKRDRSLRVTMRLPDRAHCPN